MALPFSQVPSNLRVPLFWAELDPSAASTGGGALPKSLLIGQGNQDGGPQIITSEAQAADLYGFGSDLHRMVIAYRRQDPFGELWACPIGDNVAADPASLTLIVNGTATGPGTMFLYLGGVLVTAGVSRGDVPGTIASALMNAINNSPIPVGVTASVGGGGGILILTHRHGGTTGNNFEVRANYRGRAAGQTYPPGITMTIPESDYDPAIAPILLSGGATDPINLLPAVITLMGDEPFDYIGHSLPDPDALDLWEAELADRWGALKQVYGHAFTAKRADVATLIALGESRNDPHHTIFGYDAIPTTEAELAAALTGAAARELRNDPARPLQTIALEGILPPLVPDSFTATSRNSLLYAGIACGSRSGSKFRITRAITTYRENAAGGADDSLLDVETLATLQYVLRYLRGRIEGKYPRHKIVNDGTRVGAGSAVVSPSTIRAELVSAYMDLEALALVENRAAFIEALVVERNALDPSRLDVLFPPDLVQGLRVFALLMQFRLQYAPKAEG